MSVSRVCHRDNQQSEAAAVRAAVSQLPDDNREVIELAAYEGLSPAQMRESAGRGGGRLGAATLYRSIKQLLDAGLISEAGERVDAREGEDQRRRYYRMTDVGRRAAEAEAVRLAQLVTRAHGQGLISGASLLSPGPV